MDSCVDSCMDLKFENNLNLDDRLETVASEDDEDDESQTTDTFDTMSENFRSEAFSIDYEEEY